MLTSKNRHSLKRLLVLILMGTALDIAVFCWMRQNTLANFRASEALHDVERTMNDAWYAPVTMNHALNRVFHNILDEVEPDILLCAVLSRWQYRNDMAFWDVPMPVLLTMADPGGDCDDYARLAAYVLHYRGYTRVYYVSLVSERSGHALVVYHHEQKGKAGLVDINGWLEEPAKSFSEPEDTIRLVTTSYPDTRHVSVRTWDLRRQLSVTEVKQRDETPSRHR